MKKITSVASSYQEITCIESRDDIGINSGPQARRHELDGSGWRGIDCAV